MYTVYLNCVMYFDIGVKHLFWVAWQIIHNTHSANMTLNEYYFWVAQWHWGSWPDERQFSDICQIAAAAVCDLEAVICQKGGGHCVTHMMWNQQNRPLQCSNQHLSSREVLFIVVVFSSNVTHEKIKNLKAVITMLFSMTEKLAHLNCVADQR